jgi:hypothetical protein
MKLGVLFMVILLSGCASKKLQNPRIPSGNITSAESDLILDEINSLQGEAKECKKRYIKNYQRSLYEYCKDTDGGKGIGGGCEHEAYAWSITSSVLKSALESCKSIT